MSRNTSRRRRYVANFPGISPRGCLHGRENPSRKNGKVQAARTGKSKPRWENPSRERERADVPAPAQEVPGRVAGALRSDATELSTLPVGPPFLRRNRRLRGFSLASLWPARNHDKEVPTHQSRRCAPLEFPNQTRCTEMSRP